MSLILNMPPAMEARVQEEAMAAGTAPDQWLLQMIADVLAEEDAAEEAWAIRVYDEAQAELAAGAVPIPLEEAILMNERERVK